MLREEFAFLFQTFSRSDLPGKAPLTRGRYVFQKKKKKEEGKEKKENWSSARTVSIEAVRQPPFHYAEYYFSVKLRQMFIKIGAKNNEYDRNVA